MFYESTRGHSSAKNYFTKTRYEINLHIDSIVSLHTHNFDSKCQSKTELHNDILLYWYKLLSRYQLQLSTSRRTDRFIVTPLILIWMRYNGNIWWWLSVRPEFLFLLTDVDVLGGFQNFVSESLLDLVNSIFIW